MTETLPDVDVAVVGAGLAGLTAARELVRSGRSAVVLEARDRVGGRTWNLPISDGVVAEGGGQWIGPTQDRIAALAAELGVDTFRTYGAGADEGRSIVSFGGRGTFELPEVGAVFAELDRLAAEIPIDAPWMAERASEWDSETFSTWLRARVADPAAMTLLRRVVAAIFTTEADELSVLHVLVYIRSAGSFALLTNGAQEQRFVGGSQRVSIRLAEELGTERVLLGSPVRRIDQRADKVVVEADGVSVHARRAIVAVPLALMDRITFLPALPAQRAQLHQRVAPGSTVKIHAVYETPFWRKAGLNGRVLAGEGAISVVFDNSPPSGAPGILVGFAEGDEARRFNRMTPDARRKSSIDCLVSHFGEQAANPIGYVEVDWSEEEWTRGCYGANFFPGAWTRFGEALREPIGLVHWAGAETSAVWMNYMDGAVRSGERAAAEVAAAFG